MKLPPCNCCKTWEDFDNKHNAGEWSPNGYQEYLNTLTELSEDETTVSVQLNNVIDTTFLRALGIIKDEADIARYHVDGRDLIRLTIKFNKGKNPNKRKYEQVNQGKDITSKKYGKAGI